jgi:prevent-host-death family protein
VTGHRFHADGLDSRRLVNQPINRLIEGEAMKTTIGAFEAKTKLPELLRQVRSGRAFTITSRGQAVADLVPTKAVRAPDPQAAIEKFQAFLREHPVRGGADVRALIEEGRE